jgi:hypothetical protein
LLTMLLSIDVVDNTVDTDYAVDAASIVWSFQLIASLLTMLLSIDDGVDAASIVQSLQLIVSSLDDVAINWCWCLPVSFSS